MLPFRLPQEFKKLLATKYDTDPVIDRFDKIIPYNSMKNLPDALKLFINEKLVKLDPILYKYFKGKPNHDGYSRDTILRLFRTTDTVWQPCTELIDLLCWYVFDEPYEMALTHGKITGKLTDFKKLKSYRHAQSDDLPLDQAIIKRISENYHRLKYELLLAHCANPIFKFQTLDLHDLNSASKLPLREIFGEDINDNNYDIFEERLKINKDLVKGLKVITPLDTLVIGFIIMYPITKACDMKIQKGIITKSDEFEASDICKDFNSAFSIYISLVYGIDASTKGFIQLKLIEKTEKLLTTFPNITSVYVRPTTDDGFRECERFSFAPLEKTPSLYHQTSEGLLAQKEQ